MIVVVGPSGSGKDSLMRASAGELASDTRVRFVKRVITRQSDPDREDHLSVKPAEFKQLQDRDAFSVTWNAHNLWYGIPVETIARIASGTTLVVNGSREALPEFRRVYESCRVIWISVSADTLAQRLKMRNAETARDIDARLNRTVHQTPAAEDFIVNNDASLAISTKHFIDTVRTIVSHQS